MWSNYLQKIKSKKPLKFDEFIKNESTHENIFQVGLVKIGTFYMYRASSVRRFAGVLRGDQMYQPRNSWKKTRASLVNSLHLLRRVAPGNRGVVWPRSRAQPR